MSPESLKKICFRNRYHIEKSQKFDRFKPGVISKELRDALGLRSSEIPLHIYQMRILGYPPGWIEEIKQYSSGLEFIDSAASSSLTEGSQTISFDYDRIIEYPGFNVPVEPHIRDVSGIMLNPVHFGLSLFKNTNTIGMALFEFPSYANASS